MKCHICDTEIDVDKDNYYYNKEDNTEVYCIHCGKYINNANYMDTKSWNDMDETDCEFDRETNAERELRQSLGQWTDEEEKDYIEAKKNYEEGIDYIPYMEYLDDEGDIK